MSLRRVAERVAELPNVKCDDDDAHKQPSKTAREASKQHKHSSKMHKYIAVAMGDG